jgi:hypothetical protein
MGAGWFESAAQDVRYAVRSLRGAPTFFARGRHDHRDLFQPCVRAVSIRFAP